MRKLIMVIAALLMAVVMAAHEFWIQPDKFLYEAGETIYLRFWVGENFEGENWKGNVNSIENIQIWQNDLEDQLTDALGEALGDSLEISLHEEGTAMITMQTRNKLLHRDTDHETDSVANEYYQRNIKTIIQVGDELNTRISGPTELPLDIIPLRNPYDPAIKDSLKFLVKFKGGPLKGQLMKAWHRENNKTSMIESMTDSIGGFSVPVEKSGKWMVSTVYMIGSIDISAAWQSYWGSCTWGYYR